MTRAAVPLHFHFQEMAEKICTEYARIANVRYVHFDDPARLSPPSKAPRSPTAECPSSGSVAPPAEEEEATL